MEYLRRQIEQNIIENLIPNRPVVLLGARRTGKTELVKHIISQIPEKKLVLTGDDLAAHDLLEPQTLENYKLNFAGIKLLVIDEAQKIPNIGNKLKLLADNLDGLKILVTGSAAFDMSNQTGEPLTGRKKTFYLYPFSQSEYFENENILETKSRLNMRLVFGNYPELIHLPSKQQKTAYLHELSNSYLLKDILEFDGIRNADKIRNLLRLIAFQIGKEVSLSELASNLEIHKDTVARYLDLLSKTYVIFKVEGLSRNLRKEITKMSRWYFYDNGIRNVVINNLNDFELRNDKGELWENYLISERLKFQTYNGLYSSNYFWRTYDQQEIDWIEERDGKLFAYEIKLSDKKKTKIPSAWAQAYPDSEFQVVTPANYLAWIAPR